MSRAAAIRRQLDLMAEVRDRATREDDGDFRRWMDALAPLTDTLIRELHAAECETVGQPFNPWCQIVGTGVAWEDGL